MNEIDQLQELLGSRNGIWDDDDQIRGWEMTIPNGVKVEIEESKGKAFQWKARWADQSEAESAQAYPTVQDAKNGLRKAVEERLAKIIDENSSPA